MAFIRLDRLCEHCNGSVATGIKVAERGIGIPDRVSGGG